MAYWALLFVVLSVISGSFGFGLFQGGFGFGLFDGDTGKGIVLFLSFVILAIVTGGLALIEWDTTHHHKS